MDVELVLEVGEGHSWKKGFKDLKGMQQLSRMLGQGTIAILAA